MAVHVNHVVEVPRPATLAEGPELLPEELDQRIADDSVAW
jgi:hypothetical protein